MRAGSTSSRRSTRPPATGFSRSTIIYSIKNAVSFVDEVRRRLPVAIERIQTDHGNEFGTDFTWHLRDLGISHRHIPPGCPESNGKVERSHRTDEDEFYRRAQIHGATDLARKLQAWEREYNHR